MYLISKLWSKIPGLTEQLKSHSPELVKGWSLAAVPVT